MNIVIKAWAKAEMEKAMWTVLRSEIKNGNCYSLMKQYEYEH